MDSQANVRGPLARVDGLVVTEAGDELLVYDTATHHIHHLNPAAAGIWRLCDGRRTVDDLRRAARIRLGVDPGDDGVQRALAGLAGAGLLVDTPRYLPQVASPGRRRALKRAALAGMGATIVSITAPSAAAATSITCDGVTRDTCFLGGSRFSTTGTLCCSALGVKGTCQPAGSGTFCTGALP